MFPLTISIMYIYNVYGVYIHFVYTWLSVGAAMKKHYNPGSQDAYQQQLISHLTTPDLHCIKLISTALAWSIFPLFTVYYFTG